MKWFKKITTAMLCVGSTVTGMCAEEVHNNGLLVVSLGLLTIAIMMIISDGDK